MNLSRIKVCFSEIDAEHSIVAGILSPLVVYHKEGQTYEFTFCKQQVHLPSYTQISL